MGKEGCMHTLTLTELTARLDAYSVAVADGNTLRNATFLERIRRLFSPRLRTKHTLAVLELIDQVLHNAPRVTPKSAFHGHEVYSLRLWLTRNQKNLKNHVYSKKLKTLKTELTAYRLGITVANMDASPGLQEFTDKKAFLHNFLAFYDHILKTENENSEVQILMNDRYVPWPEAKAAVVDQADAPGIWPRKYGEHGLINSDFSEWSDPETRAYPLQKHPLPGKYLFTYCIFTSWLEPRFTGEHSWFRLTTPEGVVYEFGKYRPPRIWGLTTALVNYPATIQSPDMTSMWPVAPQDAPPIKHTDGLFIAEIPFEITEDDFERALKKITEIKQRGNHTFGLFDDSCVVLANEVARECGIEIDTSSAMMKLFVIKLRFPLKGIEVFNKIQSKTPKVIVNALYYIPAVLTNLVLCALFGARKRYKAGGKSHIDSVWDIFDPSKSTLHHPWYLATVIKDDVEANRPRGKPFGIPKKYQSKDR